MLSKFIHFVKEHQTDIILLIGVILISLLSFAMGYITAKQQEKKPIQFEFQDNLEISQNSYGGQSPVRGTVPHKSFGNLW